jgi:hypothetical protein
LFPGGGLTWGAASGYLQDKLNLIRGCVFLFPAKIFICFPDAAGMAQQLKVGKPAAAQRLLRPVQVMVAW